MDDFSIGNQSNRRPSRGDTIRTRNSIIEEIRIDRNTGYVTISYGIMGESNMVHMELVTLIISGNTVIRDSSGRNMRLSDLREGMVVDAEFSSAMTFSVPPQSRAFRIIVVNRNTASNSTTGRVVSIDYRNGFLNVGYSNCCRPNLMRFVITNSTVILDRRGNQTSLRNIRQGQLVRVEHATFQTPSIPPQTTAFVVQII